MSKNAEKFTQVPESTSAAPQASEVDFSIRSLGERLLSQIQLPEELQQEIDALLVEAGEVEHVYQRDRNLIDREALQDETSIFGMGIKFASLFFKKRLSEQVKGQFGEVDFSEETLKDRKMNFMAPIQQVKGALVEKGLGVADEKGNILLNETANHINLFGQIFNVLSKKSTLVEEDRAKVFEMTQRHFPLGGTIVSSRPGDMTQIRMATAAMGIKYEMVSPRDSRAAEPVDPHAVRMVRVPKDTLPLDQAGWNLDIVDRFVKLLEKGDTIWEEKPLHAMALVRKGMKVEEALKASKIYPAGQKNYSKLVEQLNTLEPLT